MKMRRTRRRCSSPDSLASSDVRALILAHGAYVKDRTRRGMSAPRLETGLENRYMAHLTDAELQFSVMCLPVDALNIPKPVKLVKIDVEGHELRALKGMERLLKGDHPLLIVEGQSTEVAACLASVGYSFEQTNGSPNRVGLRCG